MSSPKLKLTGIGILLLTVATCSLARQKEKSLVLQEMCWPDVQNYLKDNDMVIIPLGSTEQHGRHLPLGTDCYEALGMSKKISEKTHVVIAPVLWVGYSVYHSGFAGTLSLKPETMEQVLYETAQMLIQYGFKRIMFFNYHGGNKVVQDKVIHRINHNTEAVAIAIGHGSPFQTPLPGGEFFDNHAGKSETSIMLHLRPDLVKMDRAEKPQITFTPQMEQLRKLAEEYPDLTHVWNSLFGVPAHTQKGGASHQISSNGVWSFADPKDATEQLGQKTVDHMVNLAVNFINAWKKTDPKINTPRENPKDNTNPNIKPSRPPPAPVSHNKNKW